MPAGVHQVRAENLPFYMDIGLTALKLGEEARVDLLQLRPGEQARNEKTLRYTWNREPARRPGPEFHEPGQTPLDELKAISDAGGAKQVREKRLLLGRFTPRT